MSFILDALKKSEIERQEQAGPSVAHVREGQPDSRRPLWIAGIAGLLAVNLIVLLFFAFRSPAAPEPAAPETEAPASASGNAPTVSKQPARRSVARPAASPDREVRPLVAEAEPQPAPRVAASSPAPAEPSRQAPSRAASSIGPAVPDETATLPTFNDLVVDGRLSLPPLHLDIHVYSDVPASRFVFIDGRKYHEGERLTAGPQVERITETGVVLSHEGEQFLLPRM
ncbi:MAG: general secretion pathway protein GspB [Gammaproteobacteria bacterium]